MKISLSDHFTYGRLIRFVAPSVAMMVFTSVYGVVDGYFVSNFVGKTAFAAVNFIMPFIMILGCFGFMFGAGGSALVSKTLGEGDRDRANRLFSLIFFVSLGVGFVIAILGIVFIRPVAYALGARDELLDQCALYGRIILAALPAQMLQQEFQSFFVVAEKPRLGLASTVAAGVTNMVLDALFIAVFRWEVAGAALATAASQLIGGLIPVIYFSRPNSSLLRITKTAFDGRALLKTVTNGSSELMSSVSMSLVGMLYNVQLMKYAGENGVAAYGVLMYVCFVFISIFIGFTIGSAPVVGFHYGADHRDELKSLLKKSFSVILTVSLIMFTAGELLSGVLSRIFVGYDADLFDLTHRAFSFFSFAFLFSGVAIYGSGFFTALSNGPVSAAISFLRTLVFEVSFILILPTFFGTDGIWLSNVLAEFMAAVVTLVFLAAKRKKYGYF